MKAVEEYIHFDLSDNFVITEFDITRFNLQLNILCIVLNLHDLKFVIRSICNFKLYRLYTALCLSD